MRILLLLLVTHTHAAPLDPQVEQRELHNEAKVHHRFAAWAESHGWHQDGPHHEQKSEHKAELTELASTGSASWPQLASTGSASCNWPCVSCDSGSCKSSSWACFCCC
jgi:hypothetical protein